MTKKQRRALEILWDHGPLMASAFGQKMWPNSKAKNAQGLGMGAGGFLGKLKKRHGWVEWYYQSHPIERWGWRITTKGLAALREERN